MKKIFKNKKILVFIVLFVIISMALSSMVFANDGLDLDFDRLNNNANNVRNTNTAETLYAIFGRAIDIVTIIGVGVAFVMLIVLGIKYVSESADGKAKIKETMTPYVIGVVVIIAASAILQLVETIANAIFYG